MGTRVSKQDVKVPHFFFGEVSQRNEFSKDIIVVFKKMLRKDEYDDWLRVYEEVKNMKKESLLIPESYEIQTIKKFFACCQCPADFEMSISYERFDFLFKSQLVQRKKSKQFYRQQELFFIFYSSLIGLKEFQLAGKKFGDIRPSQMVITNQKSIKMINVASFPWELTSLDKILEKYDNTTKFYLAPQEIQSLNKRTRTNFPNAKTEAFSLGMSILEAALLENSEQMYELNPRSLNQKLLGERIQKMGKQYPLLKNYLNLILKTQVEERYSGGELWSLLDIYSEKILENQKFSRNQSQENNSLGQFRKRANK